MKFCALVLELNFPQIFCHPHTGRQTFSNNSQIVFRTFQKRVNPSKSGSSKIFRKPVLFSIYVEENSKKEIMHLSQIMKCVPA